MSTTDTGALGTLNPMQQAVVDALGKPQGWEPLPNEIVVGIADQLTDSLADVAEQFTIDKPLWVSKGKLTAIHGCETNFVASLDSFEWTLRNVKGTVLHKAIELGINWRGEPTPGDVVDEALAQLSDDERSAGEFIEQLSPAERAQLRSMAIDAYSKFDECFPPLKNSWRPVLESSARVELFGGRINLSTRADLTLGAVGAKVIVDMKSGRVYPNHREELRFYALVESLRAGVAPRMLATYSLETARADVEPVTEGVLLAALRKTVDGIRQMAEIQLKVREPNLRACTACYWCPLADTCEEGIAFIARRNDPDADDY